MPGVDVNDLVICSLGRLLLPTLRHPDQANPLFVDHVLLAVGVNIAQAYGGMRTMSQPVPGWLAPWQERRAKEIIAANLGGVPVAELARECELSRVHLFARVSPFRRKDTIPMANGAPHRGGKGKAAR
jgi:AraC family transcriptional regulator